MTPDASSSVCQNSTALKMPSAMNCMSRCFWPLSSGGQRMLKCHASTGSVRGRYMSSASGAPALGMSLRRSPEQGLAVQTSVSGRANFQAASC